MHLLVAVLLGLLLAPTPRLTVSPRVAFSPTEIHIRLWVPRASENRGVRVALFDPAGFPVRVSAFQLNGEHARQSHELWWKSVSGNGTHTLIAQIFTATETPPTLLRTTLTLRPRH